MEFAVGGNLIQKEKVTWQASFNVSFNKNELSDLHALVSNIYTGRIKGGVGEFIQSHQEGYPLYSFLVLEQVYDANGKPIEGAYTDQNGDGEIDHRDRILQHQAHGSTLLGLSSFLEFKNWVFSFVATLRFGNYVYNNTDSYYGTGEMIPIGYGYLNAIAPDYNHTQFRNQQLLSNYYVQNAAYFKLNNLTARYDLTELLGDKFGLGLYITAQNLFYISNYSGPEPELVNGIDIYTYPHPRTFLLGVQFNLN